jgi:O-Antigen ligase
MWALLGGLPWAPFWYGSNDLVAWGINAVVFPGLALIYELSILMRGKQHPIGIKLIALPAGLFAGALVWTWLQTATWVPSTLIHPIWGMAADALERPVDGSISVNRDATALALIQLITVTSVFWLTLQLCRDAQRATVLLKGVGAIVCFYAVYGLVAFAFKAGRVPFMEGPATVGVVTSTFVNRNSFATYAGIGLVVVCGLILRLYRHQVAPVDGPRQLRIASFIETTGEQGAVLLGGAFVILVALLLTLSRGGIIATGLGLFVLGLSTFRRQKRRSTELVEAIGFGTIAVAGVFLVFGDTFVGSLSERGFGDANRLAVDLISLRSILDAPLTGYGLGTFADIFPMYRDRSISVFGIWEQAHNSYVEIFQGLGLLFGSMFLGSILLLVIRCVKGVTTRRENVTVPRVAVAVSCLVGVHALVDFSLQMQAVALTYAALLGAGVAQSKSSRVLVND